MVMGFENYGKLAGNIHQALNPDASPLVNAPISPFDSAFPDEPMPVSQERVQVGPPHHTLHHT